MLPDEGWEHQIPEISTGTSGKSNSIASERATCLQLRNALHIMPVICSQLMSKPHANTHAHLSLCFSLLHTKQLWTRSTLLTWKKFSKRLFLYLWCGQTCQTVISCVCVYFFKFMFKGVILILKSEFNTI